MLSTLDSICLRSLICVKQSSASYSVLFAGIFSSCSPKTEGVQLHFDENGEFKILQLNDLHYVYKDSRSDIMFERMEELLDFEKPDLVVFTGDLIYAPPADSAYLDLLSHITSRNLPFAICFGNHDDNWGMSNTELYDLVRTIPGNLFPEYRAELPRVGFFGEPVCDPQLNSGLFNAMLKEGSRHFTTWVTLKGGERIDYLEY